MISSVHGLFMEWAEALSVGDGVHPLVAMASSALELGGSGRSAGVDAFGDGKLLVAKPVVVARESRQCSRSEPRVLDGDVGKLDSLVNRLGDDQKALVAVFYFAELAVDDKAALLGCCAKTMYNRVDALHELVDEKLQERRFAARGGRSDLDDLTVLVGRAASVSV